MSTDLEQFDASREVATLSGLLQHRALNSPDESAYVFLVNGNQETLSQSYADLDRKARAIAARLQRLDAGGERALLLFHPGHDYLAAFFGCLYAGVIAVPAYPPRLKRPSPRIAGIVRDSGARFALTTSDILVNIEQRFKQSPELAALEWLETSGIDIRDGSNWRFGDISPDAIAFLQYTSGSTGRPKGVMLSHRNLMHNLAVINDGFQIRRIIAEDPETSGVFWLPIYHDMGLIGGILEPMYVHCPGYVMSPASFLQRPVRWLEAISRHHGVISGAPNFAYQMCVDKISPEQCKGLDLSSWKLAFSGAEPVRRSTLDQFAQKFAPYGFSEEAFYPCYGLAEATLIVAGGAGAARPSTFTVERKALRRNRALPAAPPPSTNGDLLSDLAAETVTLVSCGHALLDQRIEIVDPDSHHLCAPGEIGEIWAAGDSVAAGYWQRPELTAATFQARLANGVGPFLRTGDLGFVHEGQLFVTGRIKDLIIIRGRNHYPQDIEDTVQACHPALEPGMGAAFSVESDDEERLVIIHELRRQHRRADVAEVTAAIRQAVAEVHGLQAHAILLLKPLSIPKTTSGKIKRYACRADYLANSLKTIGEWRAESLPASPAGPAHPAPQPESPAQTSTTIRQWLTGQLAGLVKLPLSAIEPDKPFTYYGVDSAQAVALIGDLESWLGLNLAPTLVWDYPDIKQLSAYLADTLSPEQAAGLEDVAVSVTAATQSQKGPDLDPIAIVGLGCRFPGAGNPQEFWDLLYSGGDAIREVPVDRFDVETYYHPEEATQGRLNTRWGGFLDRIDEFDPAFFGISPREAVRMDPQQRLLLEVAWEALEHAGQAPSELAKTQTGVFVGISANEYSRLQFGNPQDVDAYAGTGNAYSIAANRISYALDLRGPSMAMDTACSSSLVAVHQAVQSLRMGESNLALAGGVNLILSPEVTIFLSQARAMAPDGRCKTFDARADGYVRSEGCGMVVLKRLQDAQRDGDNILAVIHGSAVNQDGRSNGLTAPNSQAQQAVIRQALHNAGAEPTQISYVEAHGTGTPLGDPIEIQSLRAVLDTGREQHESYYVGSVKTNIGHLEAAAGIAGLIKTVLALQHETIPPHIHFQQLNPYISLAGAPLRIPTEAQNWPKSDDGRLAGVSSFGFGGTNAHIIVGDPLAVAGGQAHDEAAAVSAAATAGSESALIDRSWHLLTLSGPTPSSLYETTRRYAAFFEQMLSNRAGKLAFDHSLADICFTASSGRNHQAYRLAVAAARPEQMAEKLQQFAARFSAAEAQKAQPAKIAFLFGGAGNQYPGMGQSLYESSDVFRAAVARCDVILQPELGLSIRTILYPELFPPDNESDHDLLLQMTYTQPALFVLEYALYELWRSWDISPDMVLGHSVGEYVAAFAAGALDLGDALRLVTARARLMSSLVPESMMAAVFAPVSAVEIFIGDDNADVSISAVNAPQNVVISGRKEAVLSVIQQLAWAGIDARPLEVSRAAHSPLVSPMAAPLADIVRQTRFGPLQLPMVSTVDGRLLDIGETLDEAYWLRHLRQPVLFQQGMELLAAAETTAFVEISPQPSHLSMGRRCLPGSEALWLPSLRKQRDDWQVILEGLGKLYVSGANPDWRRLHHDFPRRKVPLPTTTFDRQKYWFQPTVPTHTGSSRPINQKPRRLPTALPLYEWRAPFTSIRQAGRDLIAFAAHDLFGPGNHSIRSWLQSTGDEFDVGRWTLQASITIQDAGTASFQVFASEDGEVDWRLLAGGQLLAEPAAASLADKSTNGIRNGDAFKLHRLSLAGGSPELPKHGDGHPVESTLNAAPPSNDVEIGNYLLEVVSAVLGLEASRVDLDRPLNTLGLDSLMAIEIKGRLETDLGLSLPVVRFLEGPTISDLATQLMQARQNAETASPIGRAALDPAGPHPLSLNQQALWFLHELLPAGTSFNVAGAVRLRGAVDVPAWRRAFARLYERHAALRLTFRTKQGRPVQQVQQGVTPPFYAIEAHNWDEDTLRDYLSMEAYRPFDLQNGPIIRMLLLERAERDYVLLLVMDHIIVDLWSLSVLVQELYQLYSAEKTGGEQGGELPDLPLQYTDYVYWEKELIESPAGEQMLSYWLKQLAGELPVLNLPTDRPRPATQTYAGDTVNLKLEQNLVERLRALGQQHGATLYMTLLAAFQTLLHRYTGQDDLLVGTVLAGRDRPELAGLIGYFINPLAMRADFSQDPSFGAFLDQVRQTVLGGVANQMLPLPVLANKLAFQRDPSRPPVFETMFIMQQAQVLDGKPLSAFSPGMPDARMELPGFTLESIPLPGMPAQFDLTLMVAEMSEGLGASIHYNVDLFDRATMTRMLAHFEMLLNGIIAGPEQPVSQLPMLPPAERFLLSDEWNATQAAFPRHNGVHDLISAQAGRTPDAIAIQATDRTLTYAQLDSESEYLARHLRSLGVKSGALVGIGTERKSYLLVGLLGILKAGGAYVPLDPGFPLARLEQMVTDAGPVVTLTDRANAATFAGLHLPALLYLDEPISRLDESTLPTGWQPSGPEDLAYVIYTSGSTGIPKGVQVPHRAVVNFLSAMQRTPGIRQDDNLLAVTTISFDIAALELFLPLTVGGKVTVAPHEIAGDGAQLAALLNASAATIMQATPAGWQMLLESGWHGAPHLRKILCGGEALGPSLAEGLLATGVELWNMYGPTETTVWSTTTQITDAGDVTIGRPIDNTLVYILDKMMQPAPIGVPGDLYIGGAGVATGYLNQPQLSAGRFVSDPFRTEESAIMYKTGDKARYRSDGNIIFLGRDDHQVKIRGFRIELGDIEAALAQHPAGQPNTVIVREDRPGDKRLVAYLARREDQQPPSTETLREFLSRKLPDYMMPGAFVFLESFPLTPNGKVDRRALPAPMLLRPESNEEFTAPRTRQEKQLAKMVAEILSLDQVGIHEVGIHDNFFELGGNSLLATRLIYQVSEMSGAQVPLRYLFAEPTIAGLIKAIDAVKESQHDQAEGTERKSLFGDMTLEALQREVVLPPDIVARDKPLAAVTKPAHIFLTGVTGFVGAFLLHDLLLNSDAVIECLVRAENHTLAFQRLKRNLDRYDLWDDELAARIAVTPGDLAKPRFGLSQARFDSLAASIDSIYHNGAMVNFVYPFSTHRGANIQGTIEVLRLASLQKIKAVHFVSTLSVLHTGKQDDGSVFREDVDLVANGVPFGGYAQSKWVAEQLVLEAGRRGIPVAIYRPGPVSGHSQTGVTNTDDMLSTLARVCLLIGSFPDLDVMADLVPVNYVSGALTHLSFREDSFGKTFHLANSQPSRFLDILDWIRSRGYSLKGIPYESWRNQLLTLARQFGGDDWGAFLPLLEEARSEQIYMPAFDCSNADAGLVDTDVRCEPLTPALLDRYLDYFQRQGFIPAPTVAVAAD